MKPFIKRDASFIIRIWWEKRRNKSEIWRGQIIHVQTGQTIFFQQENDVVMFIQRMCGTAAPGEEDTH